MRQMRCFYAAIIAEVRMKYTGLAKKIISAFSKTACASSFMEQHLPDSAKF
ncbi:MAG: hypothetical protein WC373_09165 [Smithella sp.]